jgi:hypothetical protein
MILPISLGLFLGGVGASVYGYASLASFPSSCSRFFAGSPNEKTMWLLIGGVICAITGFAVATGTNA